MLLFFFGHAYVQCKILGLLRGEDTREAYSFFGGERNFVLLLFFVFFCVFSLLEILEI